MSVTEILQGTDGETMEAIIRAVGMEEQMLRQLIMTMPMTLVEEFVEEKALNEFDGFKTWNEAPYGDD